MWKQMLPGLRMTLMLTVLTGLVYPGVVTGLCQVLFRSQANGSLIVRNGQVAGSALIGQNFSRPEYFQPRPSAAGTDGYDATASGGSNLGPTSQKLMDRVKGSVVKLRSDNPTHQGPLPADIATASASGLDPHVSPATAAVQTERIAQARGASPEQIRQLVDQHTEGRDLGLLGEARVNVLVLNLALDERFPFQRSNR
ncbi:MAG TPA: potassium-transporting ATPase subunit KdpC [Paludibaculum sp.]|jgi:K+-transporting ATPase ATPase C chain